jgi:hypothetical protein
VDTWSTVRVSIGSIVSINPENGWTIEDDDKDLYRQAFSCYLNNDTSGPVLYPHLLFRVSSLGIFRGCQRSVFFRETHLYSEPTFRSVFGGLATSLVQRCVVKEVAEGSFSAVDIAKELRGAYDLLLYQVARTPMTDGNDVLIKSPIEFDKHLSGLIEVLDTPHAVLMTIPDSMGEIKSTKAFPGFGISRAITEENIWSFQFGLIGRPSCVVEVKGSFVPIEVVTTFGATQTSVRLGNMLSLAAQLELLREKYGRDRATHGFVWYLGNNQRFWLKPDLSQLNHVVSMRNMIISAIVHYALPPSDRSDCRYCVSRPTCALYDRMIDRRDYVPDLDSHLPQTMTDLSSNASRSFFNTLRRMTFDDSLSIMWSYFRLNSMPLAERAAKGCAVEDVEVVDFEERPDINNPCCMRSKVTMRCTVPGGLYHCIIDRGDAVLVTRDGALPAVAFGNVLEVTDEHLIFHSHERVFAAGQHFAVDFFRSGRWFAPDNHALSELLTNPRYAPLRVRLVDFRRPQFEFTEPVFDRTGLNLRQIEAVRKALQAVNYLLINAPHGSGRIATCLRIILAKVAKDQTVLVAPYFNATLNKLCAGLEILGVPYVVCGRVEKIHAKYRHRSEDVLLQNTASIDGIERQLKSNKVFLVTSSSKQMNLVCNRAFDLVILMEASRLPVLRAVPSLSSGCPFILFGDLVLDSRVQSIFSHLAALSSHNVVHLWELYNCEPDIVAASRIVWGSELTSAAARATVSLDPLKVLGRSIRGFFAELMTMDRPIVYVQIDSIAMAVMTAVIAGLVFQHVQLVGDRSLLPRLAHAVFRCKADGGQVFTKLVEFMQTAAARVVVFSAKALVSQRKDVVIAVAHDCDSESLELALGLTRRKLILMGDIKTVGAFPLWSTLLSQMPSDRIFQFPRQFVENEAPPFRPFLELFGPRASGDIEDLLHEP